MINGQLKSDIDKLWDDFWSGGIANPLSVIEQISFLIFARLLDIRETAPDAFDGVPKPLQDRTRSPLDSALCRGLGDEAQDKETGKQYGQHAGKQ